jgi:hypothetical protein
MATMRNRYNGVKSFGAVPAASAEPPSVDALAESWSAYIAWLRNISITYGKPIMATELGYQSRPRSYVSPAGSARFNPGDCSVYLKCYSLDDQRRAYAAFYQAFGQATSADSSWFGGIVWWLWRSDPSAGGSNDASFTPMGKPAAEEMRRFAVKQNTLLLSPGAAPAPDATSTQEASATEVGERVLEAAGPWPHKENGIVVGSGEWTSWEDQGNSSHLNSLAAARSLASAKTHGVNAAEFIPTWYFPTDWQQTNSTSMYRGQETQAPRALATDTDDELRAGIAAAKALGMKTSLSPMFDPDISQLPWWNASSGGLPEKESLAGGGASRGKWGAGWSEATIEKWFDGYGQIIVHYAELAQETGCDAFHVGHELHTMLTNAENERHWRKLIGEVRAVYQGQVSVAFNGNPFFNDMDRGGVPWIDALDFIGLDCYWPIYTNISRLRHFWEVSSVDEIVAAWQPTISKMENISRLTGGKTITCTEVGYQVWILYTYIFDNILYIIYIIYYILVLEPS